VLDYRRIVPCKVEVASLGNFGPAAKVPCSLDEVYESGIQLKLSAVVFKSIRGHNCVPEEDVHKKGMYESRVVGDACHFVLNCVRGRVVWPALI
jgi:hypothetical protein